MPAYYLFSGPVNPEPIEPINETMFAGNILQTTYGNQYKNCFQLSQVGLIFDLVVNVVVCP